MQTDLVYALHGFLGQSSDWFKIRNQLNHVHFYAEDLFSRRVFNTADLLRHIQELKLNTNKNVFLGYSLGGRIGLHILQEAPETFDHYIFLSVNPGLSDEALKKTRIEADQNWAKKITLSEWNAFLKEWNAQPVLAGLMPEPERQVSDYNLESLKSALDQWSLGWQPDFTKTIQSNKSKITWVTGAQDAKYCEIAQGMKNKKIIFDYKKVEAGHRIWLDNPDSVVQIISSVLLGLH